MGTVSVQKAYVTIATLIKQLSACTYANWATFSRVGLLTVHSYKYSTIKTIIAYNTLSTSVSNSYTETTPFLLGGKMINHQLLVL